MFRARPVRVEPDPVHATPPRFQLRESHEWSPDTAPLQARLHCPAPDVHLAGPGPQDERSHRIAIRFSRPYHIVLQDARPVRRHRFGPAADASHVFRMGALVQEPEELIVLSAAPRRWQSASGMQANDAGVRRVDPRSPMPVASEDAAATKPGNPSP